MDEFQKYCAVLKKACQVKETRQKKNHIISDFIYIKYPEKTDQQQQKDLWLLGGEGRNWEVIAVEQEGSFGS